MLINVRTTFDPVQNGYKFINYFQLPKSIKLNLPFLHISSVSLPQLVYGLCGGMCFSALDYYHANEGIPGDANVPAGGSSIFDYLVQRQLASLDHGAVSKVLLFMLLPDEEVNERIPGEVAALRASLDAGNPAVLVLIRAKGLSDPSHNHQVTAIGYDLDPDTNAMTIYLYDPNHPGEKPCLTLNLTNPKSGLGLAQSTGEPLRGFFVNNYAVQAPA